MHLIQLHYDGIHNATVVINTLQNLQSALNHGFVYRPPARPYDCPHLPSICHTGGSVKNGRWRLCYFHRTVNPYLQFHSEILAESSERGRQTRVGMKTSYFP